MSLAYLSREGGFNGHFASGRYPIRNVAATKNSGLIKKVVLDPAVCRFLDRRSHEWPLQLLQRRITDTPKA